MKHKALISVVLLILCSSLFLFHLIYLDAKNQALYDLTARQMIHARQAKTEIESYFINVTDFLTTLSKSDHVINLDPSGRKELDFALSVSPEAIRAITRVDARGRIVYTTPNDPAAVGKDISRQEHVHKILESRLPVVSDVFDAVQGYRAVALHVPVFERKEFRGTLAVLIDFPTLSERFLHEIKVGETGYAWMISRNGTELYCPVPEHTGASIFETCRDFPDVIAMANKMVKGKAGTATYLFDRIRGLRTEGTKKRAVYLPIKIADSFWTIVVASSEDEILSNLVGFKNKILAVIVLIFLTSLFFSYYGMKAWGIVKEAEERKKAEESLRKSEALNSAIVENISQRLFLKDRNSVYLFVNESYASSLHLKPEAFLGMNDFAFFPKDFAEKYRRDDSTVMESGREMEFEESFVVDGVYYLARTIKIPVRNDSGEVTSLLGISEDITERRRAEEEKTRLEAQLRQAQKMEAIGTLAGGIAHDFNNILAAIMGYAELALMDVARGPTNKECLEQIVKSGLRAKDLVQQILNFSRHSEPEKKSINPAQVVAETLKLLKATLPATIEIIQDLEEGSDNVLADATQLHQLLMNLCTNAAHAMEDRGGTLKIGLRRVDLDGQSIAGHAELNLGAYFELTVSDTGQGMGRETMDRIFDPFFTTKETGRGTGMGLAVAHGIVKAHGGAITVTSVPGEGSEFRVYLPVMGTKPEKDDGVDMGSAPRGTEHILLVDDERNLVHLGEQTLTLFGYRVTARTSSVEALEAFKADPDAFDLVVTDQTMPRMTGLDLTKEIHRIRPDLPVIICTGYSSRISPEIVREAGIKRVLMKPLTAREIMEAVRQTLDENRAAHGILGKTS